MDRDQCGEGEQLGAPPGGHLDVGAGGHLLNVPQVLGTLS